MTSQTPPPLGVPFGFLVTFCICISSSAKSSSYVRGLFTARWEDRVGPDEAEGFGGVALLLDLEEPPLLL